MLSAAMVLMILAGIIGFPAVMCSGTCAGISNLAQGPDVKEAQAAMEILFWLALAASIGSIIVGALVRRLKKLTSGILCFVFAGIFALLIIQLNFLGLAPSLLLLISGIMIFVAPADQFTGIAKVKMVE